jgi:hypothetical protein
VFSQTRVDEQDRPVRDEASTSYVAAVETAEDFGLRLYSEAWNRGWSRAQKKVVLGDGAVWIWNLADKHFPNAIQIVDLYHARQHLWELAAELFGADLRGRKRWASGLERKLDQGKVDAVVKTLREFSPPSAERARLFHNKAEYFERNAERIQFRGQGPLWARASWKPAAKRWPARDSNSRACSGRCAAPTLSWPCAATASAASSKTAGDPAPAPLDLLQICRAPDMGPGGLESLCSPGVWVILGNTRRRRWHIRQVRQRGICNLQVLLTPQKFESLSLRHFFSMS